MSQLREPAPVRLLCSLLSADRALILQGIAEVSQSCGPAEWMSPELAFDRTRYYEAELGWPLWRRFVFFESLVRSEQLVEVKLATHELEQRHLSAGRRSVNVDPGYLSAERVVLATGKNYTHRIHLARGIFADLTLIFHQGSYRSLDWTYPDYADRDTIGMMNAARQRYLAQLRGQRQDAG